VRTPLLACLAAALLAACDAGPAAAPAATSGATTATTTFVPVETCPVTKPNVFQPPAGGRPELLAGWTASYGNDHLWVGGLGTDGVIAAQPYPTDDGDSALGWKFGWWRETPGRLTITGRRLDAPAPPLRGEAPDGYGEYGFQASGVRFPTEGCWEVTGSTGAHPLTFVVMVSRLSP
jgi:hypothetical protein